LYQLRPAARSTLFPYTTLFRSMGCDVDPDKLSAGQPNDDKGIEQVEANARNNEQVHGGDVRRVVRQEGAPALGRRSTSLDHVLRDRKSTRLNSSHDQISYAVFC